ncbi:MAG: hypothetical protein JWM10_2723 [Myxococcaceae bacterium]|nr:hypothetical protein [Myxococcaceae bacterium]
MKPLAALMALIALSGCTARCELEDLIAELREPATVDCGRAPAGVDPAAVDACAIAAVRARQPFAARAEFYGRDSFVRVATVGARDGRAVFFNEDHFPCGAEPGCDVHTDRQDCNETFVSSANGREFVGCRRATASREVCRGVTTPPTR